MEASQTGIFRRREVFSMKKRIVPGDLLWTRGKGENTPAEKKRRGGNRHCILRERGKMLRTKFKRRKGATPT